MKHGDSFKALRAQVTKTISNIPTVPFAAAVAKFEVAMTKVEAFAERFDFDLKTFDWFAKYKKELHKAKVTRREMAIVAQFINLHKDKTSLKVKISKEKGKAEKEGVFDTINACVAELMSKAEKGRDIGPTDDVD